MNQLKISAVVLVLAMMSGYVAANAVDEASAGSMEKKMEKPSI